MVMSKKAAKLLNEGRFEEALKESGITVLCSLEGFITTTGNPLDETLFIYQINRISSPSYYLIPIQKKNGNWVCEPELDQNLVRLTIKHKFPWANAVLYGMKCSDDRDRFDNIPLVYLHTSKTKQTIEETLRHQI